MLAELDQIDWSNLHGAYALVPEMGQAIRRLASRDPEEAAEALEWVYDNLFHQGTTYEAAAPAVRFLLELAENPAVHARDQVLGLVMECLPAEEVPLLTDGVDPDVLFADVKDLRINPSALPRPVWTADVNTLTPEQGQLLDVLPQRWEYDAYCAVEAGVDAHVRLAGDADVAVRRSTMWALAMLPQAAGKTVAALRQAVRRETDPHLLAIAMMSLGLVDHYLDDGQDVLFFEEKLGDEHPLIVRRAAALALGTLLREAIPPAALDLLIDATEDRATLERDAAVMNWGGCSFVGYFWRVLHSLGF